MIYLTPRLPPVTTTPLFNRRCFLLFLLNLSLSPPILPVNFCDFIWAPAGTQNRRHYFRKKSLRINRHLLSNSRILVGVFDWIDRRVDDISVKDKRDSKTRMGLNGTITIEIPSEDNEMVKSLAKSLEGLKTQNKHLLGQVQGVRC